MKRIIWAIIIVALVVVLFHIFSTHIHQNKTVKHIVNDTKTLMNKV